MDNTLVGWIMSSKSPRDFVQQALLNSHLTEALLATTKDHTHCSKKEKFGEIDCRARFSTDLSQLCMNSSKETFEIEDWNDF